MSKINSTIKAKTASNSITNEESLLTPQNSSRFFTLLLIWSLTPLLVVICVQAMPAMWAFASRFLLAAPIAHLILKLRKQSLPLHKSALLSYLAGSLGIFVAMILTYASAQYLPSSIISMTYGLSPLLTGVIGLIFYNKQLSLVQWAGIVFGVLGLSVALGVFTDSLHVDIKGIYFIIPAILASASSLYLVTATKANVLPMPQTVGTLWVSFFASVLLLPFIWKSMPTTLPDTRALVAITVLVFFASIVAFICMFDLNKRVSPTAIALVTIITPILATIWGNLFNNEPIHQETLTGLIMIVTGLSFFVWGQTKQQH